ncbi:hypothetical protein ACH4TX_41625 [Streptomyces sp. NPDC021098]|uniref:hypothetical protein n=1 Tax=unclassified Streptomyces TaxID=2593676 RepID=UPI0037885CB2
MTGIQTVDQKEQQPGPVVWILTYGEADEGGDILGVYATKALGLDPFVAEARDIHRPFRPSDIREDDNGAIHFECGCDRLTLKPHTVTTTAQLA